MHIMLVSLYHVSLSHADTVYILVGTPPQKMPAFKPCWCEKDNRWILAVSTDALFKDVPSQATADKTPKINCNNIRSKVKNPGQPQCIDMIPPKNAMLIYMLNLHITQVRYENRPQRGKMEWALVGG